MSEQGGIPANYVEKDHCKTVIYTVDLLCGQFPQTWIPEKYITMTVATVKFGSMGNNGTKTLVMVKILYLQIAYHPQQSPVEGDCEIAADDNPNTAIPNLTNRKLGMVWYCG